MVFFRELSAFGTKWSLEKEMVPADVGLTLLTPPSNQPTAQV